MGGTVTLEPLTWHGAPDAASASFLPEMADVLYDLQHTLPQRAETVRLRVTATEASISAQWSATESGIIL